MFAFDVVTTGQAVGYIAWTLVSVFCIAALFAYISRKR